MERIREHMVLVERTMQDMNLTGKPAELYDPIKYFISLGGKRLRPALCITACELVGGNPKDAVDAAMGIEMFHNFTLVHDDIMDQANLRRGKTTVHEKWNLNTAILSGDTMLVKSYQLISKVKPKVIIPVLDTFSKTAIEVCEGQQNDMSFETRPPVSETEYLEMIRQKTSVLLGGALKIGGLIGGANKSTADLLYEFGVNIGIAFQIQDDLLDAFGNPDKVGKKAGGDIILNKQTILRIYAWHAGSPEVKDSLAAEFSSEAEKVRLHQQLFENIGSRKHAEAMRDFYFEKALSSLKSVPGKESLKQELNTFSEWLIMREH